MIKTVSDWDTPHPTQKYNKVFEIRLQNSIKSDS